MTFDHIQAKCPNPCCWSDLVLQKETNDSKLATFRCMKKSCKVDIVSMQIDLINNPEKKTFVENIFGEKIKCE